MRCIEADTDSGVCRTDDLIGISRQSRGDRVPIELSTTATGYRMIELTRCGRQIVLDLEVLGQTEVSYGDIASRQVSAVHRYCPGSQYGDPYNSKCLHHFALSFTVISLSNAYTQHLP